MLCITDWVYPLNKTFIEFSVPHLNDNCLNLRGPTRIAYEVLSDLVETTYRSGKINVLKDDVYSE